MKQCFFSPRRWTIAIATSRVAAPVLLQAQGQRRVAARRAACAPRGGAAAQRTEERSKSGKGRKGWEEGIAGGRARWTSTTPTVADETPKVVTLLLRFRSLLSTFAFLSEWFKWTPPDPYANWSLSHHCLGPRALPPSAILIPIPPSLQDEEEEKEKRSGAERRSVPPDGRTVDPREMSVRSE